MTRRRPTIWLEMVYGSEVDIEIDLERFCVDGKTLQADEEASLPSMTVISASAGSTSDLTLGDVSISGTIIKARATGGTADAVNSLGDYQTTYIIKGFSKFSSDEIDGDNVGLIVYDKVRRAAS